MLSASPLLAVVLVLVTTRPSRVALLFLLGWAAGIAVTAGLIVAFVDTSVPRGLPPTAAGTLRLTLSVILGVLAIRSVTRKQEDDDSPPRLIGSLASWSPQRAFTIGFALGSINPKNLALTASGAAAILGASTQGLEQTIAVIVFAMVASLGIATPIVLHALGGPRVHHALQRATDWMSAHGKTISAIVLTVFAVILFRTGLSKLGGL